ncbi:MAG: hypothetical protein V4735_06580 [Pseudomonadota bacterium]
MSITNPALNLNFATAESARLAYAERGAEDAVANQLKAAAQASPFQVGTTITARYQYKVAADGSLLPLQTQITSDVHDSEVRPDGRGKGRNTLREQPERHRQTFTDINRPRPQLSPTDELALFADVPEATLSTIGAGEPTTAQTVAAASVQGEAVDEMGETVSVEIIAPESDHSDHILVSTGSASLSMAARAQASVAGLYARNNDIVYSMTPLAMLAA